MSASPCRDERAFMAVQGKLIPSEARAALEWALAQHST